MKKVFFILCALAALTACDTEGLGLFQNDTSQDNTANRIKGDFGGLKLDLTITLGNATAGTKATVKNDFAVNDVVFVTLTGYHYSDRYIELKKTGASEWTATPKNGMDLSLYDETGTMTAVYFPYGSSLVPYSSAGSIQFDDEEGGETVYYGGLFYQAENAAYTITNDDVLCGTLNMVAPPLTGGAYEDDLFIHFDISGFTSGHNYVLYQENVKPFRFTGINPYGIVVWTPRSAGTSIQGYEDTANGIISFSGLLDASAVGTAVDYQFSIIDWTDSIAYTRSAGSKTLSASKYIGIGDISSATWNAMEFVDLGINSMDPPYDRIYWAKRNVGATADDGRDSYGYYFAWGDPNGYASSIYHYHNDDPPIDMDLETCTHKFNTAPEYEVDVNNILLPAYDGASATLKGFWRMPTQSDVMMLSGNTSKTYSEEGVTLTGTRDGFESRSIFMPATGDIEYNAVYDEMYASFGFYTYSRESNIQLVHEGPWVDCYQGLYWLSNKDEYTEKPDYISFHTGIGANEGEGRFSNASSMSDSEFIIGRPIRPVFTLPTE